LDFEGMAGQRNGVKKSLGSSIAAKGGGDFPALIRLSLVELRPRRARLRFAGQELV
jgi:hypothetical protein